MLFLHQHQQHLYHVHALSSQGPLEAVKNFIRLHKPKTQYIIDHMEWQKRQIVIIIMA
jgi:hypothetical protein